MTAASFGRKGAAVGEAAQPRPLFGTQPRAFGAPAPPPAAPELDDEMARRRAAFIAQERARAGSSGAATEPGERGSTIAPSVRTIYRSRKSMGVAYLIWFLLGQTGAHRFYLGQTASAAVQLGLWVVNLALMLNASMLSIVTLIAGAIWIIGDAFLIPGMVRRANEQHSTAAISEAFA